jgi:hypothetical protein
MSFEETVGLDDATLRARMSSDDPVERVWAIWALALRAGASSIAGHLTHEPEAGVRRHLAVVLAGGGEVDLLVAMSRHDPAPGVRAVATGLVTRLALGNAIPWEIAVERMTDPSPLVRCAVLAEIPANTTHLALASRAIGDPDADVRLEAFDVFLRNDPATAASSAISRLDDAGEHEAIGILIRWSDRTSPATVIDALHDRPRRVRLLAIAMLGRSWDAVASIALDPDPKIQQALREQFTPQLHLVPVDILARWITDTSCPPNFEDAALDEIRSRPNLDHDLASRVRALCTRRRDSAAEILHASGIDPAIDWSQVDLDDWDNNDSDLYGELAEHQRMTEILDRLA